MKTIPLTSYNIFEFECDDKITDLVIDDIKQKEIVWKKDYFSDKLNDKFTLAGYLGTRENLIPYYNKEVFEWFNTCLSTIADEHFKNFKLTISDSWLTKSSLGQVSQEHIHVASIYSGLLYLTSHTKSETSFMYDDAAMLDLLGNCHRHLIEKKTYLSKPEKNKLIIFPSNIPHKININIDAKKTRHTLAFNAVFDGLIGDEVTGMLNLKVLSVQDRYEAYMNKKNNETM